MTGRSGTTEQGATVVTGAAGFIGRQVVAALRARGVTPLTVDHRWSGRDELESLLGSAPVSACLHLGWQLDPAGYLTDVAGNAAALSGSLALLDALAARDCRHLVVTGTCAEYAASGDDLGEQSPLLPASPYAATKHALHRVLTGADRPAALTVTWARLFNVSGQGERAGRLLPDVCEAVLTGHRAALSDGRQIRDYLDVHDVASALVGLAGAGIDGPVNVCSGRPVVLRELLTELADLAGGPAGVRLLEFGARPRRDGEPGRVVGDPARLAATGWAPRTGITAMLQAVVADVRARLAGA